MPLSTRTRISRPRRGRHLRRAFLTVIGSLRPQEGLRTRVLAHYRRSIMRRCEAPKGSDLRQSAIVFSPHYDDESLGCGGTICQKRKAGAEVGLVFMTDGSKSHQHLMPGDELRRLRAKEGLAAGRVLGLADRDIYFLGFEESQLEKHEAAAVDAVLGLLHERCPRQVFIPYRREPLLWSTDHRATTRSVLAALERWDAPHRVVVFEYPIWFYRQWPWTPWGGGRDEKSTFMQLALTSPLGLGIIRGLRHCFSTADVRDEKRAAIAAHRSQMQRIVPHAEWATLSDVAGGSFLDCFLQDYELFDRYVFAPGHRRV
jgi:LmbE family N-acetylglucosaminyl deacetylase